MTISGVNKARTGEIVFEGENIEKYEAHNIVDIGIAKFQKEEEYFQD